MSFMFWCSEKKTIRTNETSLKMIVILNYDDAELNKINKLFFI